MLDTQGVFNLKNQDQLKAWVKLYEWGRMRSKPTWFALLNNLGSVESSGSYKTEYNKVTGVPTKFTTTADQTSGNIGTFPDINATATCNLEHAASGIPAGILREGVTLRFTGTIVNTGHAKATTLIRVEGGTAGAWTVRTIAAEVAGADWDTLSGANRSFEDGTVIFTSTASEFGSEAPDPENYIPTNDVNFMQFYERSFGKNFVEMSQPTKFNDDINYLGLDVYDRVMQEINNDIIFSTNYSDVANGKKYSTLKGLAGFLGLADTSVDASARGDLPSYLENPQPVTRIDTGTSIDFGNFSNWVNSITQGSDVKTFLTSAQFAYKIIQLAKSQGDTVRTNTITFPKFSILMNSVPIGDKMLNVVVDRNLSNMTPLFYDGTNTAAHQNMGFAIDMNNFKIQYHDNVKYGVMTPMVREVLLANGRKAEQKRVLAALTPLIQDLPSHGAYGLTNS